MSENEENFAKDGNDLDGAALEALLSSGLIVGPDPSIIEEIKAQPDPTYQLAHDYALENRVSEIYEEIISRAPEHKIQPSLDRVRDCLDLLGNPQNSYRCIHITGTNGKTSTARMIEALLRERGLRTGRFTSPHLSSVRERITIDGCAISAADFIDTWEDVKPFIELIDERSVAQGGPRMSFFEVFTVMAYSAFAMAPVDVAVIEVGMGGRWDATNVIDADVAVLMPVAADHEKWLGSTLTQIATEKLGILKPGKTLVCAAQVPQVLDVVAQSLRENSATVLLADKDFGVIERERAVGGQMMTIKTPAATYVDIPLAMLGAYQADNAAVALTAVEAFFGGGALNGEVVEHALMATTSPGRLEVVKGSPAIIVDAAHNPAGAIATVEALEEYFPGPRVAVFAAMADKDVEGILGNIEPAFSSIVITDLGGARAMDIDELAGIAVDIFGDDRVVVEPDLGNAITSAADIAETVDPDATSPACVVVMGSIMLAAQARELLGARKPDSLA
ncbi:dihydrofolate synthase/folylpolyglutamate synthase [Arcanobacterium pluranimalium]|uniref:bifunctional folylpolyglutamate synthase/dihydrofolate synthase n=1 Tax=Arcanobacterium pluranimalium TaxID=108028 RepID=UPI00195D29EF|nr:folylpolyglutamate synthase/dihydrofolate synthase family protein [Arcanobacterium pluranimalium]MBM7825681.1 dihydrofolate synthase/folylpolyglutamate synthase [Arcanobacterium pluranimalium]